MAFLLATRTAPVRSAKRRRSTNLTPLRRAPLESSCINWTFFYRAEADHELAESKS